MFLLAAAFGAISVACIMMIPGDAIDNRAARGKEDDPESQPSGFTVLVKHKPLLILALALAAFHLGNAAIIPLYGLAATAHGQANGPTFVATTIVVAQAVMILTSIVGMRAAESRNYWPVLLASFLALPVRGGLAFFLTGWWALSPCKSLAESASACTAWRYREWWPVHSVVPAGSIVIYHRYGARLCGTSTANCNAITRPCFFRRFMAACNRCRSRQ